jgi:hypothetical protein
LKNLQKLFKKLLTNKQKCDIIYTERKREVLQMKNFTIKLEKNGRIIILKEEGYTFKEAMNKAIARIST